MAPALAASASPVAVSVSSRSLRDLGQGPDSARGNARVPQAGPSRQASAVGGGGVAVAGAVDARPSPVGPSRTVSSAGGARQSPAAFDGPPGGEDRGPMSRAVSSVSRAGAGAAAVGCSGEAQESGSRAALVGSRVDTGMQDVPAPVPGVERAASLHDPRPSSGRVERQVSEARGLHEGSRAPSRAASLAVGADRVGGSAGFVDGRDGASQQASFRAGPPQAEGAAVDAGASERRVSVGGGSVGGAVGSAGVEAAGVAGSRLERVPSWAGGGGEEGSGVWRAGVMGELDALQEKMAGLGPSGRASRAGSDR